MIWLIWLFATPSSPVSKLDREVTHRKTEKERQLDQGRRGKGVGKEPNNTTARKLRTLYIIQYSLVAFHHHPPAPTCVREGWADPHGNWGSVGGFGQLFFVNSQ
jgi:hypothetical protein